MQHHAQKSEQEHDESEDAVDPASAHSAKAAPEERAVTTPDDALVSRGDGIDAEGDVPAYPWLDQTEWPPLQPPGRTQRVLLGLRDKSGLLVAGVMLTLIIPLLALLWFENEGSEVDFNRMLEAARQEGQQVDAAAPSSGLSILSDPPGAEVLIDFEPAGVTPLPAQALAEGAYVLSLRLDGYAALDTVIFATQGGSVFEFVLEPESPALWAAETSDSWDFSGTDNGTAEPLAVSAPPNPQESPLARVSSAAAVPVVSAATGTGALFISAQPVSGSVYLDGILAGETPLLLKSIEAGEHEIRIERNGYSVYETTVALEEAESEVVAGQLEAVSGALVVLVRPWGSIFIDGKLHRRETDVQYSVDLPAGTHQVRVVNPTLGVWERSVEISGGGSQQLFVNFNAADHVEAEITPASSTEAREPAAATNLPPPGADGVYMIAEEPPQLLGGVEALSRKARYPQMAYKARVEGKVFLKFVVDEEGNVHQAQVTRGLGLGCDEEALRLIREARFAPGRIQGQPVKVWHALFIAFNIPDN